MVEKVKSDTSMGKNPSIMIPDMLSNRNILFVDDSIPLLNQYRALFEDSNVNVFCAESAEKAIEILKIVTFSVMFIDLVLPNMNGLNLCKLIRKRNRKTVLYALSGFIDLFGYVECLKAGFDDCITKPVDYVKLVNFVNDGLRIFNERKLISL